MYAGESGGQEYYKDIRVWRREDPKFSAAVREVLVEEGNTKDTAGRHRNDAGDASWQEPFCEALLKHDFNKEKARVASGCPYSLRRINEMLQRGHENFDKDFHEKVHEIELLIASEFEEMAMRLRRPELYEKKDGAHIAMAMSNIALRTLEKVSKEKYGRELNMKGSIEHRHLLESRYVDPRLRLAQIDSDMREFQDKRMKLIQAENQKIESNKASAEDVIEAEIVGE